MQSFDEILDEVKMKNNEYIKLCNLLEYEEVLLDKKLFLHLDKQKNLLNPLIENYKEYLKTEKLIKEINDLSYKDKEKILFEEELKIQQKLLNNLQEKIKKEYYLLLSKEEKIIIEITKNQDDISSKLFEILIEGYSNFCSKNNLNFFIEKQKMVATFNVNGYNAKSYFESEVGTHLAFLGSLQGLCRVFVYNCINVDNYNFSENELQITACRSSGAGGQHINKTESSIKIIHLPTGISAVSQDERSQFQNKQKALCRLKEKVENYLQKQKTIQIEKQKKQQFNSLKTIVRNYDLENQNILKNGKIFLLKNFLQGYNLN